MHLGYKAIPELMIVHHGWSQPGATSELTVRPALLVRGQGKGDFDTPSKIKVLLAVSQKACWAQDLLDSIQLDPFLNFWT